MDNELQILLNRYREGGLTADERRRLSVLMRDPANQLYLAALLDEQLNDDACPQTGDPATGKQILGELMKQIAPEAAIPVRSLTRSAFRRWWAAAAVLLVLAAGVYRWTAHKKDAAPAVALTKSIHIPPGKEGAILTLADGSQVVLDSLDDGVIAVQNGANAVLKNGRLAYDATTTGVPDGKIAYNTVTTPKGRQFRIVLPDGTKAWLNAASSLRYPLAFTGKERRVEVTGETYFEVVKNSRLPFIVDVDKRSSVEVLGTSFNINGYTDEENIRTSLLEGSVKVTAPNASVILKPGQQAQIANTAAGWPENAIAKGSATAKMQPGIAVINSIDTDKVMAWKNGLFNFEDASLQEVMRQLERWYDITVVYESGIPDIEFMGKMSKNIALDDLLEILRKTKVHFRLEGGRKLVVMP